MREIKFRSYHISWVMHYFDTTVGIPDEHQLLHFWKILANTNTEQVGKNMQYTWLKDKNGKEIYEGDIIKIRYWDERLNIYSWLVYITDIFFSKGAFRYRHKDWSGSVLDLNCTSIQKWYETITQDIVIIWNIYENPELLNNKKLWAKQN